MSGSALRRAGQMGTPTLMFHLVQPWGDDKYSQATIVSTHATVAEAYAALDRIGEKLHQDEAPEGTLEIYVVDEGRQPVPRPGVQ